MEFFKCVSENRAVLGEIADCLNKRVPRVMTVRVQFQGGESTFISLNPDTEIIGTDIEASGKLRTIEQAVPSSRRGSSLLDNLIGT